MKNYIKIINVYPYVDTDNEPTADYLIENLIANVGVLSELETDVKSSLVAALNSFVQTQEQFNEHTLATFQSLDMGALKLVQKSFRRGMDEDSIAVPLYDVERAGDGIGVIAATGEERNDANSNEGEYYIPTLGTLDEHDAVLQAAIDRTNKTVGALSANVEDVRMGKAQDMSAEYGASGETSIADWLCLADAKGNGYKVATGRYTVDGTLVTVWDYNNVRNALIEDGYSIQVVLISAPDESPVETLCIDAENGQIRLDGNTLQGLPFSTASDSGKSAVVNSYGSWEKKDMRTLYVQLTAKLTSPVSVADIVSAFNERRHIILIYSNMILPLHRAAAGRVEFRMVVEDEQYSASDNVAQMVIVGTAGDSGDSWTVTSSQIGAESISYSGTVGGQKVTTLSEAIDELERGNEAAADAVGNSVSYSVQDKTAAQKEQARKNIDALGEDDVTEMEIVRAGNAVANADNDVDVLTPAAAQAIAKNVARFDAVYGETTFAEVEAAFNAHIPVYMRMDVTDPNNNITANVEFRLQRKQQATSSISFFHFYAEYSEVGYFVQFRNNGKWGNVTFRRYVSTIDEESPSDFNLPTEKAIVDYITSKLGGAE